MRLFLSYASEDRQVADEVYYALLGAGHEVFYDQPSLLPGDNFEQRITDALDAADGMIFLISPNSIHKGSYTATELKCAREKWAHPKQRVLPVMVKETDFEKIPAYIRAVTILQPEGNVAAEVVNTLRRWYRSNKPFSQRPDLISQIWRLLALFLGSVLIALLLGTLFSYLYPRVVIDSSLASLFLVFGISIAFVIRGISNRILKRKKWEE